MAAKLYSLAACGESTAGLSSTDCSQYNLVMLFYDMVLTFGDEVEKIWKQRFTGATFLWLLVSLTLSSSHCLTLVVRIDTSTLLVTLL